jgi:hypothetical protein
MDATFREWAAGREWAVEIFGGLCAVAIGLTLIRKLLDNQNDSSRKKPSPSDTAQAARFASFQRSYLTVYVIVMLADWMQGTHMYTLYSSYASEDGSSVQVRRPPPPPRAARAGPPPRRQGVTTTHCMYFVTHL